MINMERSHSSDILSKGSRRRNLVERGWTLTFWPGDTGQWEPTECPPRKSLYQSWLISFFHSFHKYLSGNCCVPGSISDIGTKTHSFSPSQRSRVRVGAVRKEPRRGSRAGLEPQASWRG